MYGNIFWIVQGCQNHGLLRLREIRKVCIGLMCFGLHLWDVHRFLCNPQFNTKNGIINYRSHSNQYHQRMLQLKSDQTVCQVGHAPEFRVSPQQKYVGHLETDASSTL